MKKQKTERSVSMTLGIETFIELETLAFEQQQSLADTYILAIEAYLQDCKPGRLKVYAAPGAGKRIRVNLDRELFNRLRLKVGNSGYNLNDIIYTALEIYLNEDLKSVTA